MQLKHLKTHFYKEKSGILFFSVFILAWKYILWKLNKAVLSSTPHLFLKRKRTSLHFFIIYTKVFTYIFNTMTTSARQKLQSDLCYQQNRSDRASDPISLIRLFAGAFYSFWSIEKSTSKDTGGTGWLHWLILVFSGSYCRLWLRWHLP